MNQKIRMGVPIGSLLDRARTDEFLRQAGWDIVGYEPGSRSYLPEVKNYDVELVAARPQEIPQYLFDNRLEVAIGGDDWAGEWALVGQEIQKLADLEYGDVRLVVAVPQNLNDVKSVSEFLMKYKGKRVICSTEYVNTASEFFSKNETYQSLYNSKPPMISMKGRSFGDNPNFIIEESYGATEGKPNSKLADIIIDNTGSGTTLRENGLKIIENIRNSTAGLYASPSSLNDQSKADKIEKIRRQLVGVVKSRNYTYVLINAPNERLQSLQEYMDRNKLYAKEPTIVEGKNWSQVGIEIPKAKWPLLVDDLYDLGIDDVIRIPVQQIITR